MSAERLLDLRNRIIKASQAYYYGGSPIMSDAEYDALEDQLRQLAPEDPLLQNVGAPVPADAMLNKARHRIPMGSQNKVNSAEEFQAWYTKSAPGAALLVSLKGDGASAAAYYRDGRLVQAISRGDGSLGEDITANAVKFKGLPVFAADAHGEFTGAVRFEAILTLDDWTIVDPERRKNPRNAGSGIMGRKNGEQAELLTCYAFDLDDARPGLSLETEGDKLARLATLGFNVIPHARCVNAEEVTEYFHSVRAERDQLPFWIDGIVIKIDDLAQQAKLGTTANRPKGQVAWKFDSKGAESTLLSYSITVGHTGALIPNAQLEPVEIGGTTVSNALLNNWDEIERLGVAVGDRVWVIKANDIIPKIVSVVEPGAARLPIPKPTACPVCGSGVTRRLNSAGQQGVVIECTNEDCPAKSLGKIKRWVKALDIDGLGDSVRQALVEQFEMADVSALYRLRDVPQTLAQLVINPEKGLRLGEKRAATILASIEATRELTLVQFLGSLGIDRLGQRRVELMMRQATGELDTLEAWTSGRLRDPAFAAKVGVPTVGAQLQDSIDQFRPIMDRLLEAGVRIVGSGVEHPSPAAESEPARTLCISGKLPSGKKKAEYREPLRRAGIELVDTVSQELTYLVLADPQSSSSKANKARKWGVHLLSEADLVALCAET